MKIEMIYSSERKSISLWIDGKQVTETCCGVQIYGKFIGDVDRDTAYHQEYVASQLAFHFDAEYEKNFEISDFPTQEERRQQILYFMEHNKPDDYFSH